MLPLHPTDQRSSTQDCGSCRYVGKCYAPKASPRNVVINILACRIKLGLNSNASAKLLLEMFRPNLIKMVNNAKNRAGGIHVDIDTLLMDLESRIIESLLDEGGYRIGESAYLTEYLFGMNPRTGWVRKWILWNFNKNKRFFNKHTLSGDNPKSDTLEEISSADRKSISDHEERENFEEEYMDNSVINRMLDIIDDGVTLNANEHRVIRFCLAHANESNRSRLIDGTHTYLSRIMGVSRPRITRLYAVARKKLLQAAEDQDISLH